jgi:hypothetical protein
MAAYAIFWRQKSTQFVCAPKFFKTPKGLCGDTVFSPHALTLDNAAL